MVALAGSVAAISGAAANGVLATGAATGVLTGAAVGLLNAAFIKGTAGAIVATSTVEGATASAILGSAAAAKIGVIGTGAVTGAIIASVTGAGSATIVSSTCAGATGLVSSVAASLLSGPVGWTILGASEVEAPGVYTFDCWKQILHDDSGDPSEGKILNEVIMDPRVKHVTMMIDNNLNTDLPRLILENIWDERFRIEYVTLFSDRLAAHAVKL
jgi:hypothetical protein